MIRSVVQIRKTYYICIPKAWVNELKMFKGTDVVVELRGRSVLLTALDVAFERKEVTEHGDKIHTAD